MSLDVILLMINFFISRKMCGPIEKCCCCFPAKVGVKFIGGILILVELVGVIYITVILSKNNKVPMESENMSVHLNSNTTFPGVS